MTQYTGLGQIPNGGGASVRGGINAADTALASMHAGTSAPSPTYPRMWWDDTANELFKRRTADGGGWEIIENYGATVSPSINDDMVDGYRLGSRWLDGNAQKVWICLSPAAGAANWVDLGQPAAAPSIPSGVAPIPASIPAGGSVEVVVSISGAAPATHAVTFLHVPSTSAKLGRRGVVTAADQATVTLTNESTSTISGLSGNITVKANSIAAAPGSSGTAAMPASIPAGGSVEAVVSISGIAAATHAVTFLHIPSTSPKLGRRGVVTAADQATVTLTNESTSTISGLSGNITAKAESIS